MLPLVHQITGTTLVLAGLIVLPLPIPLGLIMLTIGFALLAPYIPAVQRLIRYMREKWPNLDSSLRRYRDRFPPVIKQTIDKTHPFTPAE
ncbi:PGPGW domain-containing protein [Hyphococcus sp.]|uniref:PGPGW domain-containing protein n=1 Tax=Hyphococcus sp. TaxID=2038636 RepID=UPI003CCC3338